MRASKRLLTCDGCRLLFLPITHSPREHRRSPWPAVCSGIPSLPSLLELGGLQARPGDPGPRQLGQVSGLLAGRRVQTPDKAGSGGCWGNLASGPGRELGFGGKRAGAACRIQQAPLGARNPSDPVFQSLPGSIHLSCRVDSWLLGQGCRSSWVATALSLPSFGFLVCLCPGEGAVPGFLEFSSPKGQAGIHTPSASGTSLCN